MGADGKWQKRPGLLQARIRIVPAEDLSPEIDNLFTISPSDVEISPILRNCKHKLYAVRYHEMQIKNEIQRKLTQFQTNYRPPLGIDVIAQNHTIIYHTEAFLFQVKSSLDILSQIMSKCISGMNFHTFAHSGSRDTSDYLSGGKLIRKLKELNHESTARMIESASKEWITELARLRDQITHYSELQDMDCFIEKAYLGGPSAVIHYPTMPSGMLLTDFLDRTKAQLHEFIGSILKEFHLKPNPLRPDPAP